ncbi:polysaccharide deacetylase family protein [Algibacter amylolyticus]|uniref:Polysaccharide deacetylase family protein n=1 Tax=Algibacter amylolyticus TaxID=1608400 RepID=A0A5M7BE61_9FLAO|nr:polysaccharide deacetylase family protein [Algibacter amylolyticus]KAA5827732.1 polysaccharide deacetylase family protein [Algibacter amylolyticus]MBB5266954.1 peptidoglycan/xylan/chitin deacetylase (PgdA/CDA1 family) [Algibacter amylolyticus]TSJ81977.1 polysaccharide deacetylase family protein [Algibacter amylolyticus]
MGLTPVKTPVVVKKLFPNYIWEVPTNQKVIYLTFDDGPTPEITNWTLMALKQYNAKATFFCIGNNVVKHPEIFNNVLNDGHAIGNHTHNHVKGWKTKAVDYLDNVYKAQEAITSQIAEANTVNLFRPPYGQITPKQGKKLMALGYSIIMWDVLSFDWDKTITPEACLQNVISKTTAGSVIVFHDSVKASKNMQYALPKVLAYFSDKGYRFEALNTSIF